VSQSTPQEIPPRFQLARMISSLWVAQAVYAAARLGLADACGHEHRGGRGLADPKAGRPEGHVQERYPSAPATHHLTEWARGGPRPTAPRLMHVAMHRRTRG